MKLAPSLAILLIAAATAAPAQDCVDHGDHLRVITSTPIDGSARQAVVASNHAYVAGATGGLAVFDLDDPDTPRLVHQDHQCGTATALALHAPHLYVADDGANLHVYDLSVPDRPVHRADLALPAAANDLGVRSPHLLVAAGAAGLLVLDLANPAAPVLVGSVVTPGLAWGVAAGPRYAVVADDNQGLAVIDLDQPHQPRHVGSAEAAGYGVAVSLSGNLAFMAAWNAGLAVVDIARPQAPKLIAQMALPGVARGVTLRDDDLLFVAAGGLSVVDVADPQRPQVIGRAATSDDPVDIALLDDSRALICTGPGGLDVADIDPPLSPPRLAEVPLTGVTLGLATDGTLTAAGADDLHLLDTTDPTVPVLLATLPFVGNTSRLAMDAGRVFLTTAGDGGARLLIADVTSPLAPTWLSSLAMDAFVSPVLPHGDAVYLADFFHGGLLTVDVSDPTRPALASTRDTPAFAQHLLHRGEHLLVGTGAFGGATIQTFDLTTPLSPAWAAELTLAAQGVRGLADLDDAHAVALVQHQGGRGDLLVLNAANPTRLSTVATLPLNTEMHALAVHDGLAYVAGAHALVHVVDLSEPTAPHPIGQTFLAGGAVGLTAAAGVLFAAATEAGLAVIPRQCSTTVGLEDGDPGPGTTPPRPTAPAMSAHPNPFNPRVTVRFELPAAGLVDLSIHDVAGRHVATLVHGHRGAGPQAVVWNGCDQDGRPLPSGRYLARLVTAHGQRSLGLTLVR